MVIVTLWLATFNSGLHVHKGGLHAQIDHGLHVHNAWILNDEVIAIRAGYYMDI